MILRVVFLGSPAFAVPSLRALAADPRFSIELVVTQPARPAGRGRRITAPPIAVAARELALPIYQPESLRNEDALDVLEARTPDMLVVVAYGELLNRRALRIAPHRTLNVHPSLLPKYRGAAPIPAAILNGDAETGVSVIRLVRKLDAGPIIRQERVAIEPRASTGELEARLATVASAMLPETCVAWVMGTLAERPQAEELATYTREWTRSDAKLDWRLSSLELDRLVRAANPWPMAWTRMDATELRVLVAASEASDGNQAPGVVRKVGRRILASCASGALELLRVQPGGKPAMDALSWWNGLRVDTVILR